MTWSGRAVRDGLQDSPVLPVLYEFPMEEQTAASKPWRDPKNWPLVTPNAGRSIEIERLVGEAADEEAKGESSFRIWASQHLNIQIGMALHAQAWAGADFWEESADVRITLDALLERCEVVDVGIDGGGLDDLLGLYVVGRDATTHDWIGWAKARAHPVVLERRKDVSQNLRDFAKQGDPVLVDQIGEDVEQVAALVAAIEQTGLLDKVGVDPAGLGGILDALADAGVPAEKVVGISQGWKLTGAIKTAERRLAEGAMRHAAQPLMTRVRR